MSTSMEESVTTTERVAKTVEGRAAIGHAHDALLTAGHQPTITGNRITVDGQIIAQYVGGEHPRWLVFPINGAQMPTWIVGAQA